MKSRRFRFVLLWIVLGLVGPTFAQGPKPVMDYTSVLNTLDVLHNTGRLQLDFNHKLIAAFLPPGATVDTIITKSGSNAPLHRQEYYVQKLYGNFWELSSRGKYQEFLLTEPGDYVATYRANGQPMTTVPFTLVPQSGGDEFDPRTFYYVDGPWNDWAQLSLPLKDAPESSPELVFWLRKMSFEEGSSADVYEIEVRKDGDVIATCTTGFVGSQEWQRVAKKLRHPENKGGYPLKQSELMARDGNYDIVLTKGESLHAVYQFEIKGGKPVKSARQASSYQPRTEYMIPRFAGEAINSSLAANVIWMKRLPESEAQRVSSGLPADVAGPSAEARRAWQWTPSADPRRPFDLVVTDIETRSDTTIRAGDDLIAFGAGFPTGVQYIRVGDTQPREIPDGETYNSMVFQVCGRKIVLVKRNQVIVYDSDSGELTPVPTSEVFLYDAKGGNHRANLLNSDGNLVVVVNKTVSVKDNITIKVIDVSGDQPRIIPIKNGPYVDRDVSSVAVDAKQGIVTISSRQQKSLYVAKIAPLANQQVFPLRDYRGIGSRQIFIVDEGVVYADEDDKIRHLQFDEVAPKALVDEAIGRSGNGYTVAKGRLVISTAEKFGTRYQMALSDLPAKPQTLAGTGEKIAGTSGALGMAGCAAITDDKTVFLAGTPSGGIGVGEHLQILDQLEQTWRPIINAEGKVISAIDVVASMGLIAFKSADKDRKTTVGYATFGERIDIGQVPVFAEQSKTQAAAKKPKKQDEEGESPYYTKNQQELDLLVGYVQTEKETATALGEAFGEKIGAQKAREMILDVMKKNGHEHLIPRFIKLTEAGE